MNIIWLAIAFAAGLVCGWCFIPVPTWLPWGQKKKKTP